MQQHRRYFKQAVSLDRRLTQEAQGPRKEAKGSARFCG